MGIAQKRMLVVYKTQARNQFVRSYGITLGGREAREGRAWRVRERWGGSKAKAEWTAVTRKGKGCRHVVTQITIIIIFVIIIFVC